MSQSPTQTHVHLGCVHTKDTHPRTHKTPTHTHTHTHCQTHTHYPKHTRHGQLTVLPCHPTNQRHLCPVSLPCRTFSTQCPRQRTIFLLGKENLCLQRLYLELENPAYIINTETLRKVPPPPPPPPSSPPPGFFSGAVLGLWLLCYHLWGHRHYVFIISFSLVYCIIMYRCGEEASLSELKF